MWSLRTDLQLLHHLWTCPTLSKNKSIKVRCINSFLKSPLHNHYISKYQSSIYHYFQSMITSSCFKVICPDIELLFTNYHWNKFVENRAKMFEFTVSTIYTVPFDSFDLGLNCESIQSCYYIYVNKNVLYYWIESCWYWFQKIYADKNCLKLNYKKI